MDLYGGIEAGGTTFVCAVGRGRGELLAQVRFPTTTPEETMQKAVAFFQNQPQRIVALGIGSFGPVDPDPDSATFGRITTTPKPGWQDVDLVGQVQATLQVPIGFDTDVNAAALAERRWGAAQEAHTFVYLTVGTGIGGGGMVGEARLHGLVHPEMGHMRIPHDRQRDPFAGVCPYHGDCLEGLASGPALEARWGQRGEDLPDDHPAWGLEAHYLALGVTNLVSVLSPQRVILGGGVMQRSHLFPLVQREVQALLNGYIQVPEILERIDAYVVPPALGSQAGVLGAIALAQEVR